MFSLRTPRAGQNARMKNTIFALAIAALAASPLLAQPQRGRVAPMPGAHEVAGELVLYGAPDFSGQSQRVTGERARFSAPFTIRSLPPAVL